MLCLYSTPTSAQNVLAEGGGRPLAGWDSAAAQRLWQGLILPIEPKGLKNAGVWASAKALFCVIGLGVIT